MCPPSCCSGNSRGAARGAPWEGGGGGAARSAAAGRWGSSAGGRGVRAACWDGGGRPVPGGHVECGMAGRPALPRPAVVASVPAPRGTRGGKGRPQGGAAAAGPSLPTQPCPRGVGGRRVEGVTSSRRAGNGFAPRGGGRHFRYRVGPGPPGVARGA